MASTQFKIVLLGESAVGKSSVVQRFVKDVFSESRESTIGAAFLTHSITITPTTPVETIENHETPEKPPQDVNVKFEIWDTAGQERYRALASMYYRNAQAALVVYDVTSSYSLGQAKYWIKELQRQVNQTSIMIVLIGNKLDLVDPNNNIETDVAAQELVDQYNLYWFKTSAKTGQNIQNIFAQIAVRLPYMDQIQSKNQRRNQAKQSTVNLTSNQDNSNIAGNDCAC